MQLLLLRKNEISNLDAWLQKSRDRFTCPEIQNEFLQIMAHSVLRNIAAQLSGRYYSIMVDKTTDVSNNEQLVFCVRYVDNKLISHEEFIGLHSMDCISAEHITRTTGKVILGRRAGTCSAVPTFPIIIVAANVLRRSAGT